MQLKDIIHPTDFSAVSENALVFAGEIARREHSKIHLIHVYERPYYTAPSGGGSFQALVDTEQNTKLKEEIQHNIERVAASAAVQGVELSRRLISDIPVYRFVEKLEGPADLIVMGTRGNHTLLHGALVGSNAERVIRTASIPVLTVPDGAVFTGIKHIAFATDFRDPLNAYMPVVEEFAKMFNADLLVILINTRDTYSTTHFANAEFAKLQQQCTYPKMKIEVYNDEDVEHGIQHVVQERKIDLLAMLTHGRMGISRLFNGSIAENLSQHLGIPLLTFRNRK